MIKCSSAKTREYPRIYPGEIPQFSNLSSSTIKKFVWDWDNSIWESVWLLFQKAAHFCLFTQSYQRTLKSIHSTRNSKLFVNLLRIIINIKPSIWRENMFVCLSSKIICFLKLTVFLQSRSQTTVRILELVIYMKKLLSSDWLRSMQFSGNSVQKRVNSLQKRVNSVQRK